MSDDTTSFREGHAACPFVAFEDDRDHRADSPDYRHRCFAAAEPEPRALPHQERFCLSAAFAACPIFLDWARQEAAGVAPRGAPGKAEEPARTPVRATVETPAFLGSRGRTLPAEALPVGPHSSDPGSGLWGFEGAPKRTVPLVTAPASTPPVTPAYSMARRQPSRPDWENPPRMDNYPRLRARDDRTNNQPLLLAALGVAVLVVVLIVGPLLASNGGGGTGPNHSPTSGGSGAALDSSTTPTDTPPPTPLPEQTFIIYTVHSGDWLQKIANNHHVTIAMIIAANKGTQFEIKNPDKLLVNQQMFIPWPSWVAPTATDTPTPGPSTSPTPAATPTPTAVGP
jgi:LysM repeat protein